MSLLSGQSVQDSIRMESLWEQASDAYNQKAYEESKQFYEAFIALCIKNDSVLYAAMGKLYVAKILRDQGAYEALGTTLNEVEIYGKRHQLFQKFPEMQGDLDFWKGALAYGKKNYEHSIYYLEKVVAIYPKYGADLMTTEFELYNNLGTAFHELGDYQRAIHYYQQADKLRNSEDGKVIFYQNVGLSLLEGEKATEAITTFKKAIAYFPERKRMRLSENTWATIFNNLGDAYTRTGKYTEAEEVLQQAQKLTASKLNQAKNTQELAKLYLGRGAFAKADDLFQQALAKRVKLFGQKDQQVASTLRQIGAAYARRGKQEEALKYYQKALTQLVLNFSDSINYAINPPLEKINSKIYLLKTLRQKAAAQQALQQSANALQTLQLADQLLDTLRIQVLVATDSKYFWLEKAKGIYEQAIPLALSLGKKELAFYFSQKSHGLLLREGLQKLQTERSGALPDSLISLEKELKMQLTSLELDLFKTSERRREALEQALFDTHENLTQLQTSIKQNYPVYFQERNNLRIAKIATIQQSLNSNTDALVEYFVGEKKLFYFVVTKNDFKIFTREKPENFNELIANIRNTLSTNDGNASAFLSYTNAAFELYELLFAAIIEEDKTLANFVIIPDEALGYLPFNVFLAKPATKTGRYDLLSYLALDYNFSYNYSSALFLELNQQEVSPLKESFVGFAPSFSGSPSFIRDGEKLDSLIYNKYEVLLIDSIVKGQLYVDTLATLAAYLNSLSHFKIAHLSTHANCDDLNPAQSRLHFYDKDISALEIYNLNLNTELVVLSACETGTGLLRKGEGIMSLARAFVHAGCPSIITSLWKVNDKKTAGIMQSFYQNLYNGVNKNIAIGNAQRSYLTTTGIASLAHPYYWASFIQVGNAEPLWSSGIAFWKIILAVALLLFIFFLIRWRSS
ncbi:MAG: CHAT domain-containing protein [Saprospiraceae bacterium]